MMDGIKQKLNKEQQRAVEHGSGPLLLIAGPGTGKTMVLTRRLAYLIQQEYVDPEQILALTFTNKAAEEMEERVDHLLAADYFGLQVHTFHSFGKEMLQNDGLDIGLSYDFNLLDQRGCWLLIRQNFHQFDLDYFQPIGDPNQLISALIQHFSRCKDEGVTPEDYQSYAEEVAQQQEKDEQEIKKIQELAQNYYIYQKILAENQALDFGDLVFYAWQLLQRRSSIRDKYQQRFKYVLVDEFQDVNYVQYELVKLLAAPDFNMMPAVDDDQSIYGFRGTSFSNAFQFHQDFPQGDIITLKQNYRSPQNILDLSYQFIQHNNPHRIEYQLQEKDVDWSVDKSLRANKEEDGRITHLYAGNINQEVREAIKRIVALIEEDGITPKDIAILGRTNKSLRSFEQALEQAEVPYKSSSEEDFYHQRVVLDLLAYLNILHDYYDNSSFYRVLNLPCWDIDYEDITKITRLSKRKSRPLYDILQDTSVLSQLKKKSRQAIKRIWSILKQQSQSIKEDTTSSIILDFLEESGYLQYILDKEESQQVKELHFLNRFYDRVMEFEKNHSQLQLGDLLDQLEAERTLGAEAKGAEFELGPEGVRVMTMHSAKGLEFDYVFLINLVHRRFPTVKRSDPIEFPKALISEKVTVDESHTEEERRLFYVGMTRAKKGLFFTSARDYGGKRKKKPSRFLQELNDELVEQLELTDELRVADRTTTSSPDEDIHQYIPDHFSYSQLKNFTQCPRQYKFTHILQIPSRGGPQRSFGRSIHKTLHHFLEQYVREDDFQPSWERLAQIYERDWIEDWYLDSEQKKRFYKAGEEMLRNFYQRFQKEPPQIYQREGEPFLEKTFELDLDGERFKGKIDRIDQLENGVEIIDYKTGKSQKRLNADRRFQLMIYKIAAEQALGLNVSKMTFYYLKDGHQLSFEGEEKDVDQIKEKISQKIQAIKNSDFQPTPGYQCQYCDFRRICDQSQY